MVLPNLDGHLGDDKMGEIAARALELLELRARQRLIKRPRRWRAAWVQRQCPDIEAARASFLAFSVLPGCRVYLPAAVAAFVRLVMFRAHHPFVALGGLLDGDLGRWTSQYASAVLKGRRPVSTEEWCRMRRLVEELAVGLSLEHEPEPVAGVDLAAVLANRLNRPAIRSRQAVDPELISLAMRAPLVAAAMPPRVAFPRYTRLATAAA
jgi:hypothetical protein